MKILVLISFLVLIQVEIINKYWSQKQFDQYMYWESRFIQFYQLQRETSREVKYLLHLPLQYHPLQPPAQITNDLAKVAILRQFQTKRNSN